MALCKYNKRKVCVTLAVIYTSPLRLPGLSQHRKQILSSEWSPKLVANESAQGADRDKEAHQRFSEVHFLFLSEKVLPIRRKNNIGAFRAG